MQVALRQGPTFATPAIGVVPCQARLYITEEYSGDMETNQSMYSLSAQQQWYKVTYTKSKNRQKAQLEGWIPFNSIQMSKNETLQTQSGQYDITASSPTNLSSLNSDVKLYKTMTQNLSAKQKLSHFVKKSVDQNQSCSIFDKNKDIKPDYYSGKAFPQKEKGRRGKNLRYETQRNFNS